MPIFVDAETQCFDPFWVCALLGGRGDVPLRLGKSASDGWL
jgi:hypothetical protein